MNYDIKTLVISLKHRQDRRNVFKERNKNKISSYKFVYAIDGYKITYDQLKTWGYDTQYDWIDPILRTTITKGEIGCFLSHYNLWEQCIKANRPFLILEDDAIIKNLPYDEIHDLITQNYDFIYLGWKEMSENKSLSIGGKSKFVVPVYPYWTLAYVITPQAAKILINNDIENNIIPVDEYLALKMKDLNPIAYKENVIYPWEESKKSSNVDARNRYDYFIDFNVRAITVGTDVHKCIKLFKSGSTNGFNFINLGDGVLWKGGNMKSTGGGQKVNLLRDYVKNLSDRDVVIFCDGYDVFINSRIQEVIYRYLEMKHRVIFAAERECWPDENLSDDMISRNRELNNFRTPYEYLNSGLFIGKVSELKKILSESIDDSDDDQLYYQIQYTSANYDMILDQESYIFQCHEPKVYKDGEQMYNPITRAYNCIYHGNGGEDAKQVLNRLYDQFFGNSGSGPILYVPTYNKYDVIDDDMILIDYMTPSMCDDLIDIADENGKWGNLSYDSYPAQEIRLKKLGLWDEMEKHWKESIYPIIHDFWNPMKMYGIRDAFVLRYALDTQTSLMRHCDASAVTGSVKLNDNYEGAELYFPRQKISNKHIPVGKCILFPGQVTHGHECQELVSGVKYSLTIWSCRYPGDMV